MKDEKLAFAFSFIGGLFLGLAISSSFLQVAATNRGFDEGIVTAGAEVKALKRELGRVMMGRDAFREALDEMVAMFTHEATASWYGADFHGKPTTSGELFDMEAMTAASLWLPIGSSWNVYCIGTGLDEDVEITDRGPFVVGRSIDLSRGAARRIGFERAGVTRVVLTPVVMKDKNSMGGQK